MKTLISACMVAGLMVLGSAAHAQYPERQITVVVPYGAGQATDVMCRVFLRQLQTVLGQTIVIENRPGAATNIGAAEASRATPDGYTLLCTGNATHVANPLIYSDMGFDPDEDLVPISGVASTGFVMAVGSTLSGMSVPEVVEAARAAEEPLKIGLASTTARVLNGLFVADTGVELLPVQYMHGNEPLFPDLIRGDTDLVIEAMPSAMASVTGDDVAAIAVTLPDRSKLLPDVPTFLESGVDINFIGWNAFYAPAGTPQEIIDTLNAAAIEALQQPDVAEGLAAVACEPMPTTPDELASLILEARAMWKPMVELYELHMQ